MANNHLKTAARGLRKNRGHSLINIAGLSVGMAVALLIGLWIWDELSFNKYHSNHERIVQVMQKEKFLGATKVWRQLPYLLINEIETNYTDEFKHVVPAINADGYVLVLGDKKLKAAGLFMGKDGPEMLTLNMLKGSRQGLDNPNGILLAASIAKAFFGDADPVGKSITLPNEWDENGKLNATISGVYDDIPQNSSFNGILFLLPWQLYTAKNTWIVNNGWEDHRFNIYVELQPNVNFNEVDNRIRDAELNIIRHLDNSQDEVKADPKLFLHAMNRWHLYSDFKDGVADQAPVQFLWQMGIIGGFVLLLACINFMNLSTARSEKRAKEVGIRKAIGSLRRQLIGQFLSESFLVVVLAFALSLLIVSVSLPAFNTLVAKQLLIPWSNAWFWLAAIVFIVVTGLLAGSYPAIYLSSFKPVKVLKGTFRAGSMAAVPRQALG